jgi:membrane-associated phospholipid phosphatase
MNSFSSEEKKTKDLSISDFKYSIKEDFLDTLEWTYKGSYKQFQQTQNLIFAGVAVLSTLYFIKNDERISKKSVKKNKNEKVFRLISDSSILFNTPIVPIIFYGIGVSNEDSHMVRFSKEYFSALTLSLLETAVISAIPVHQRPDQKELSFWETAFRGQSSFPSGHVVGYSILGLKTLQFYGPYYAIAPFAFAAATGFERVHSEKHFISDIVASGFISLLASEGVRYASGYNKNHPIYEWIFNHDFAIDYIRKDKTPGLLASFSF